jgi:hypothetical protein
VVVNTLLVVGKEKIQAEITSSIELSQKYIDTIMRKSIRKIASESNDNKHDETIATLCE